MSDIPSFGAWLKRRRKALDLTQGALAQRVGCALSTIKKIEEGVLRPSRQIAKLLAQQLAIPPDERATFVQFARRAGRCPARAAAAGCGAPAHTLGCFTTPFSGCSARPE